MLNVCVLIGVCQLLCSLDSVLDSPSRLDEEHRLIARYAARLAAEAGNAVSKCIASPVSISLWLFLLRKVTKCFSEVRLTV